MTSNTYTIHTDGGARGNPGPAAIGVVIEQNGKQIHQFGKTIGDATNNVAEYTGVIQALEYMRDAQLHPQAIQFLLDSLLVVNQLRGLFKIKDAKLRELSLYVHTLEQEVGGQILYNAIPREQNRVADQLVNAALDAQL